MKESKIRAKRRKEANNYYIEEGIYGLKVEEGGILSKKEIEAGRRILQKKLKKVGKVRVLVNNLRGKSKKPAETRMGKGKGKVSEWVCKVGKGEVIYEIEGKGLREKEVKIAMEEGGRRLSIKTRGIKEER